MTTVDVEHLDISRGATSFWTDSVSDLTARGGADRTALTLFGITFYDVNRPQCEKSLAALEEAYESLEIWSHRWPDGYSNYLRVSIPPNDLAYGSLGQFITPSEKTLLRLSLVSTRSLPISSFLESDLRNVDALQQWLTKGGGAGWMQLLNAQDIDELISAAIEDFVPEDYSDVAEVLDSPEDEEYIEVEIPRRYATQEVQVIDAVLDSESASGSTVVLAWLGEDRVLLYRRDLELEQPSLRWLLENRFNAKVPQQLRGLHYGPQDAVYFRLNPNMTRRQLRAPMRRLASELAVAPTGGRYLLPVVARDIAELANNVLESIDLRGKYTQGDAPKLEVLAADLYELIHTSSRTGGPRRTLTMPVKVTGPEAIAFMFRDGGYNFQKAERMLEGALIGLGKRGVGWLGPHLIPTRLRIDINPDLGGQDDAIEQVRSALLQPRMSSFPTDTRYVADDSVIGRFLRAVEMDQLVSYAESETIGPSVAHALTLDATASVVKNGPGAGVLDLFSGSGVANRLLSRNGHSVVSVDLYVDVRDLGLDPTRDGVWLRADARAVVHDEGALLERDYDVIGLDPPHSELVELLFGATNHTTSLAKLCSGRADVLVMYQGHSTQRGRLALVRAGLIRSGWVNIEVLQVEEELIMVSATESYSPAQFANMVGAVMEGIRMSVARNALGDIRVWSVE